MVFGLRPGLKAEHLFRGQFGEKVSPSPLEECETVYRV